MKTLLLSVLLASVPVSGYLSAQDYLFDFSNRKNVENAIKINNDIIYPGTNGYGYDILTAPEKNSNTPYYFSVNVPDGNYRVTITIGDKKKNGITTVRGESRRLFLNNVATKKNEFKTFSFIINKRNTQINEEEFVKIKDK